MVGSVFRLAVVAALLPLEVPFLCPDLEQSMREAAGAVDGPVGRALTCRVVAAVVDPPAVDEVIVATAGVAEASGWEGKDGGM
jgi:hypothetical protein